MCCNVFLSINFNLSQFHLFLTIICFYFDSYLSLLAYFIEETNNYFTYFRNYLTFCIYMRSEFISSIRTIVSPGIMKHAIKFSQVYVRCLMGNYACIKNLNLYAFNTLLSLHMPKQLQN